MLLHWLLAAALFAQIALGWWMLDIPKSPPGLRAGWFNLHKSIGLTVAAATVFRLVWRATHPVRQAEGLPRWQSLAARLTHGALYLCVLLMPLSGYLGSSFSGYPVRLFGVVLPSWTSAWPAGKQAMSSLHYATAWLLMGLVALHVGAALWHLMRRDGVAGRMGWQVLRGDST